MSTCGEPCDGCPNRAEHHLCDACCHDEVNAIQKENRELREKLEWQAACTKALMESQERLAAELKEARAEVGRLKGVTPELPPRPPDGGGLPRYGLRWNGPTELVSVPLPDGYWTPWHLADAETRRAEIEREHTGRALDDAIALQRVACGEAYQRGAEAMREAAASIFDAPISTPEREVLLAWAESIRALPVPEDKP